MFNTGRIYRHRTGADLDIFVFTKTEKEDHYLLNIVYVQRSNGAWCSAETVSIKKEDEKYWSEFNRGII